MSKCKTCGADLILVGGDYQYCSYCGNAYGAGNSSNSDPIDKNKIKHLDTGVDVFDNNINSVIEITWKDEKYLHSGSGFIISSDGYAVTNTHVVTDNNGDVISPVNVNVGGAATQADVIKLGDSKHGLGDGIDLALIKLRSFNKGKVVKFADFNNVKIGERVFVIGNSLGYGTCITSGIVSDKRRNVNGKMLLMTDCAINGGNSGGPMFNSNGEVIAVIVSGITGAEGMNFAIPADDVIKFIKACNQKIELKEWSQGPLTSRPLSSSCPKCGSKSIGFQNGIYHCRMCDYEW
ncbi:MAG: trypsin-like peptidase domain-containing protein [Clostridia bacterium]|nr:trypsin-like peptidase domain-containing protein [Clostridia bacterium]